MIESWDRLASERGGENVAEQFETHEAAGQFSLELDELPVMLVFLVGQSPLRLALPRDEELGEHGAAHVCETLEEGLSPDVLAKMPSGREPTDQVSPLHHWEEHLRSLSDRIRARLRARGLGSVTDWKAMDEDMRLALVLRAAKIAPNDRGISGIAKTAAEISIPPRNPGSIRSWINRLEESQRRMILDRLRE